MQTRTITDPKTGRAREVEILRFAVMDTESGDELASARVGVPLVLEDGDDLVTDAPRHAGGRLRCTWLVEGTTARLLAAFCPAGKRTFIGEIDQRVERAAPPAWVARQPRVEEVDTGALFNGRAS